MSKRRHFSAEFTAKVALDALSGEMTLSELDSKYKIHPNQVSTWKKQAKDLSVAGFKAVRAKKKTTSKSCTQKLVSLQSRMIFLQKAFARK
ncbi:transposase [uncultured Pseudodesulfovibrio sp.]|uniref:transposase n=1 Tax=uncultured Pseudodesulfovibrio sp. TaxID=2035858 RepID=UPI0029C85AE9|nr:transposase [uncultured Pseudodesulfovibrio sp.]